MGGCFTACSRQIALVLGAMVEKGEPSLPSIAKVRGGEGVRHITVLPIFFPGDDNRKRWLAKVIKRWHSQWRADEVKICLAELIVNMRLWAQPFYKAQTPKESISTIKLGRCP